jgi:hypothetical protein
MGRPGVDQFRRSQLKVSLWPVTITAGHPATAAEGGGWLVPKKELVNTLQVLLQARRLKVAPGLPEAATLGRELETFQVKIKRAAHQTFGGLARGGARRPRAGRGPAAPRRQDDKASTLAWEPRSPTLAA